MGQPPTKFHYYYSSLYYIKTLSYMDTRHCINFVFLLYILVKIKKFWYEKNENPMDCYMLTNIVSIVTMNY